MDSDSGLRRISVVVVWLVSARTPLDQREIKRPSPQDIVTAKASEKTWDWAYAGRECLQID